jgi:uncharacterized membrane protein
MPEKIKQSLSRLLLLSMGLAVLLVLSGAMLYLLQNGQAPVSFSHFSTLSPTDTTLLPIVQDALHFDPFGLILLGFLVLVFSQILRVLVLGFYFLQGGEYRLAVSSFFIFVVLLYSILWRH